MQDENCRNSNNGSISISVKTDYDYTGVVTGNGVNETINFNLASPLSIDNLSAGSYTICVTVAGYSKYEQCFTLVVHEPLDLAVQSKVNSKNKTVTLNLSGANSYTVNLNGKEYVTGESKITLDLDARINNILKVSTDKDCQGIYENNIVLSGESVFYPNPVVSNLIISLGSLVTNKESAHVTIISLVGAKVFSEKCNIVHGNIVIDVSNHVRGAYIISVNVEGTIITHKIIKKWKN